MGPLLQIRPNPRLKLVDNETGELHSAEPLLRDDCVLGIFRVKHFDLIRLGALRVILMQHQLLRLRLHQHVFTSLIFLNDGSDHSL